VIGCAVHCTEQVHAALWHRVRASVVRVGRVLAHGQRVDVSDQPVNDHDLIESLIETVDQHDTMIHRSSKQGVTKAVDQGRVKAKAGTTVRRPQVSTVEEGVGKKEGVPPSGALCDRDAATPYRRVSQSRRVWQ
jgi:hypothetical protein